MAFAYLAAALPNLRVRAVARDTVAGLAQYDRFQRLNVSTAEIIK